MSRISYHFVGGSNGIDNVIAMNPDSDTPIYQADSTHPHWHAIMAGLYENDPNVFDLFDVKRGLAGHLRSLSDRVSFDGENILFDGDVQEGPIADHLRRCLEAGVQDYKPVVKFWEKVAQNPDARSREQLFEWLRSHDFSITEDGDILGYKGVKARGENFFSISQGTARADGVEITGAIPNKPGTTITMPRSEVANDPYVACHKGLHVGDWSYAEGFARGAVLEVHVNPRDVVSIPVDHSARKMRCCKYKVVKVRTAKSNSPIGRDEEPAWQGDVGYRV